MTPRTRLALALLWLAALLLAGWAVSRTLELSGDLRKFMPAPQTPAQTLLIDELGEGPGSRLLLVALEGDAPDTLAAISRAMRASLSADEAFALVANGDDAGLDGIPDTLRPYRYLLSTTLDTQRFDVATLREAFDQRVQDLGSPAAALIEPLLPSDPTLETLAVAEALQPAGAPQRLHGVWFDRAGQRALLALETRAAGFDPTGQAAAVAAVHAAFDAARGAGPATLAMTGPGAFSVEIGARTQREASLIGTVDSIVFALLLMLAYRSWRAPLLGALPLATGGLAGLAAVALAFDGVHGITLAFGFTLIGVAQDYPIHLFSHIRPDVSPRASVRGLWRTLATGVVATCIAYLTFLVSGVEGLEQLAVFTIVGLGTAGLATRFALPALIVPGQWNPIATPGLATAWRAIDRLPRLPATAALALAAVAVAVAALAPGRFWENDLSRLTPVPAPAMALDTQLRRELGAPDVRYVIAIETANPEAALRAGEAIDPQLDQLRVAGALDGFDLASRYLPSAATQRARQQRLPGDNELKMSLAAALADSPFVADAFDPFVADVARAREASPLGVEDLADTPLATGVDGLLLQRNGGTTALVSLTGLHDAGAVARVAQAHGGQLLDLKQASESLVAEYRGRVLGALGLAAVLLGLTVLASLRSVRRTLRVLAPMALTTLLVLAVLRALGVELNLFHLVALILGAGLGLDYALFFDHAGDDRDEQLRTLHAVMVCSVITFAVFALLAASSIPVLRAIGGTVALAVVCNFVLSLLVTRRPVAAYAPGPTAAP